MTTRPAEAADLAAVQRRTVRVLATSQVLGGIGVGAAIAVGGLIAEEVSASTEYAGLAQTFTVLGAAVIALPMARLMTARGRRPGLAAGYVAALAGAVLMALGALWGSLAVVLLGAALLGAGTATNLQARFAAADLALPAERSRALATVVWSTTVGVVLGPNLSGPGAVVARELGLPVLAGPLVFSSVAFLVAGVVVFAGLRPDPLLLARADRAEDGGHVAVGPAAALRSARSSGPAVLALAGVSTAHTVMIAVMVMTPVHLRHGAASLEVIGIVISLHVAGMYALSPVVGRLADSLGRVPVLMIGMAILLASVVVSGTATGHAALGVGLLLLGLGWSCALIAGSTLLSESVDDSVRPGLQGASDFVMGVCGAAGGALAGVVVGLAGYGTLNALAGVLLVPVVLLAVWRGRATPA